MLNFSIKLIEWVILLFCLCYVVQANNLTWNQAHRKRTCLFDGFHTPTIVYCTLCCNYEYKVS